jgi:hypothetical protein
MCAYVNNNKPSVATEDITCYKVLEVIVDDKTGQAVYRSPNFTEYSYQIGKTYKVSLGLIKTKSQYAFGEYRTTTGLYSFDMLMAVRLACQEWKYQNFDRQYACFECIIPKGSKYYKSLDKPICQLVSDQLQIVRMEDITTCD